MIFMRMKAGREQLKYDRSFGEFTQEATYPKIYDAGLSRLPIYRKLVNRHVQAMPNRGLVIDAGGGTGNITKQLLTRKPKLNVHLVDKSPDMLAFAKSKGIPHQRIHFGDIKEMAIGTTPVLANTVDGIVCNNVLYMLPEADAIAALTHFFDCLKVSGKVSISGPIPFSKADAAKFNAYIKQHLRSNAEEFIEANAKLITHFNFVPTMAELTRIVERIGFSIVEQGFAYDVGDRDRPVPLSYFMVLEKPGIDLRRRNVLPLLDVSSFGLTLSPAKNSDRKSIARLINSVRSEFGKGGIHAVDCDLDDIRANYDRQGGILLVLRNPLRRIVGVAGLFPLNNTTVELRKMYFAPKIRNLNLGNKLLGHVMLIARIWGFKEMYLETTRKFPASFHLYKKFGFTVEHMRSQCAGPEIRMRKTLERRARAR